MTVTDHTQLPDDPWEMPPNRSTIICAFGRKGSGKSYFARRLWLAWPRDALAIDFTGDLDAGRDAELLHELPSRFPVHHPLPGERRRYRRLVWRPDTGSPTYREDLDRAIGVALYPSDNPTLLWLDEIGELPKTIRGHARRAAMQSRHYGPLSVLACGPRPADIDPLWYLQADGVAEFELPRDDDREKLAELMGFDSLREHDAVWRENRMRHGPHAFLYLHAPSGVVLACPPLPATQPK